MRRTGQLASSGLLQGILKIPIEFTRLRAFMLDGLLANTRACENLWTGV